MQWLGKLIGGLFSLPSIIRNWFENRRIRDNVRRQERLQDVKEERERDDAMDEAEDDVRGHLRDPDDRARWLRRRARD